MCCAYVTDTASDSYRITLPKYSTDQGLRYTDDQAET